MLSPIRKKVMDHLRHHTGIYFFLTVLFGMGVGFGALAVGALDANQRLELTHYLDYFFHSLQEPSELLSPAAVVKQAISGNLRTAGLIFLLGLTVVGVPLVPAIVFLRGFIVGFAVGFLLVSRGMGGLLVGVLAILPQNIIIIPSFIILSASALSFAAGVVKRRPAVRPPWKSITGYSVTAGLCFLLLIFASLVEGYIAPFFLRLVAGSSIGILN